MSRSVVAVITAEGILACVLAAQLWTRLLPASVYLAAAAGLAILVAVAFRRGDPRFCLWQACFVAVLGSQVYYLGTHYAVLPGGDAYGQFAVLSIFDQLNRIVPISLDPPPPGALDPSFYSGWPGLQLLTLVIARLSGLDAFTLALWVPQLLYVVWLALAYLVFRRLVESIGGAPSSAAVALLLFVTFPFSQPIPQFKYQNFAFVFWLAVVYFGLSEDRLGTRRVAYIVLLLLTMLATAMTHNLGYAIALVWLIGLKAWQTWKTRGDRSRGAWHPARVGLVIVMVLGFGVFAGWAVLFPAQSATFLNYGRAIARNSAIAVVTLRLRERERPVVAAPLRPGPRSAPMPSTPQPPAPMVTPPPAVPPSPPIPSLPVPPPLTPLVSVGAAGAGGGMTGALDRIATAVERRLLPNILQFTIPLMMLTPRWVVSLLTLRLVCFPALVVGGFVLTIRNRHRLPVEPLLIGTVALGAVGGVAFLAGDIASTYRVVSYLMPFAAAFAALMLLRLPRRAMLTPALVALFVFASLTGLNANRFAFMHLFGPEVTFAQAGEHAPTWPVVAAFLSGRLDPSDIQHYASDEIYTMAIMLPITRWGEVGGIEYAGIPFATPGTVVVAINNFNYQAINEQLHTFYDPHFDPGRFGRALDQKALIFNDGTFMVWR